jgi:hypothetical protein
VGAYSSSIFRQLIEDGQQAPEVLPDETKDDPLGPDGRICCGGQQPHQRQQAIAKEPHCTIENVGANPVGYE